MTKRRGNGSGKLKDEHKAFLVQRLAVFDSPKQAAEALKAEYRVEISPQGAEAYDPGKRAGRRLSKLWRELFETIRERFLDRIDEIPESHKAVRVKMLARAANNFESRGNYLAMANLLEKIAREMGGAFTNRRELTGKGAGPIQFEDVNNMTDDEIDQELRRLLNVMAGECSRRLTLSSDEIRQLCFDPDVHSASAGEH